MTNHLIPDASEREAFEAATPGFFHIRNTVTGEYANTNVEYFWKGWQARAAAQVGAKGAADLAELAEWRRLKDSAVLHASLLRGLPARLPSEVLRHIAGAPAETPKPVVLTEQQVADRICGGLIVDAAHRALINGDSVKVTLSTLTRLANFFAHPCRNYWGGRDAESF